jgi:hypothetical protein
MVVGTLTGDKTVSVMAIVQRTLPRLIGAMAVTAMLSGSASAQFNPSINLEQEKHRTPEEIQHDQAIDKAYQSVTKKIPDQNATNDPWADVRPAPQAAPEKKKQQVSQNKKHSD